MNKNEIFFSDCAYFFILLEFNYSPFNRIWMKEILFIGFISLNFPLIENNDRWENFVTFWFEFFFFGTGTNGKIRMQKTRIFFVRSLLVHWCNGRGENYAEYRMKWKRRMKNTLTFCHSYELYRISFRIVEQTLCPWQPNWVKSKSVRCRCAQE